MSQAVQDIIERIEQLPEKDRLDLEEYLAQQAEQAWRSEADLTRKLAAQRGIDQAAIDAAVEELRYGS